MARVQSILTYTLPATSDCPPAAPIRCGCHNLVLILEDQSLIRTVLRGILEVEIKSVGISSAPVKHVDENGETKYVWKYDYTVEYKDTDLTDTTYRIRKCDVLFNCCYSCALAYTDRKLKGYVQSVTGPLVNNTDPQNPIVNISSDKLVAGVNAFTHTAVDGTVVTIPFAHSLTNPSGAIVRLTKPDGSTNDIDICALVAANCAAAANVSIATPGAACFQPGPGNVIQSISAAANVISIVSVPDHTAIVVGMQGIPPTNIPNIQAVGTYASGIATLTVTNPSPCRNLAYLINIIGGANIGVENGGRFEYGIQESLDNGATWNFLFQLGYGVNNHPINQGFTMTLPIAGLIGAGATVTRLFRFAIQVTNAFNNGTNAVNNMGMGSVQGLGVTQ